MIPYRYYGLIIGAVCLLAALYAVITGLLGLVGLGDSTAWQDLGAVAFGVVLGAIGVAGVRDFTENEEGAQARRRRRSPDKP